MDKTHHESCSPLCKIFVGSRSTHIYHSIISLPRLGLPKHLQNNVVDLHHFVHPPISSVFLCKNGCQRSFRTQKTGIFTQRIIRRRRSNPESTRRKQTQRANQGFSIRSGSDPCNDCFLRPTASRSFTHSSGFDRHPLHCHSIRHYIN